MAQRTANDEDLPEEGKNILFEIIRQLRPGTDLSRVTLPTFVLEPRSMLERITNFMSHPELLLEIPTIDDPVSRFVHVIKFYLSGWHIKPPGVKKPLNPVLGENFRCRWTFPEYGGTQALYVAEQVSHHPPISAYFYYAPEHNIRIDGVLMPKSRFFGNSAGVIMMGNAIMTLLNHPGEKYVLTQPNMYAKGILFGKMRFELGDESVVRCEATDMEATIEFKTKGMFSGGGYNVISGSIKKEGELLYKLSGKWDEKMDIKPVRKGLEALEFDAAQAQPTFGQVRPRAEQEPKESQNLWHETCDAVRRRDQVRATETKAQIEDSEREERRQREQRQETWQPRFFDKRSDEDYIFKLNIDTSLPPKEQLAQIEAFVKVSSDKPGPGPERTTTHDSFVDAPELAEHLAKTEI